ncbi:MAG: hypothetical protein ACFBSG_14875 [Leptolyngbyaceae cyanobacterium]
MTNRCSWLNIGLPVLTLLSYALTAEDAIANTDQLCPSRVPTFQIDYDPRAESAYSSSSALTDDSAAQRQFIDTFDQYGYDQARRLIGSSVSPEAAAAALVTLASFSGTDVRYDSVELLKDALTLLNELSDPGDRRDEALYLVTTAAARKSAWSIADEATRGIQRGRLRLTAHTDIIDLAKYQAATSVITAQRQQAHVFLSRQPSYQAVLLAELAALAKGLNNASQLNELTMAALEQVAQVAPESRPDQPAWGTSHRQASLALVARALAEAHQFDAAYQLTTQLEGNTAAVELAIATQQIEAGELAAGVAQVLAIGDRGRYSGTIAVARALARAGEINCSIAVLLPPQIMYTSFSRSSPQADHLAETLLIWAQSDRIEAVAAVFNQPAGDSFIEMSKVMAHWGEAEAWTLAEALANALTASKVRYEALQALATELTQTGQSDAAARIQAIADHLASTATVTSTVPPLADLPESQPLYTSSIHSDNQVILDAASTQLQTGQALAPQDPAAALSYFQTARQMVASLPANYTSQGTQGAEILSDVALGLYTMSEQDLAEQVLLEATSLWSQVIDNPGLGATAAHPVYQLRNRYVAAGWYTGAVEWVVHPMIGSVVNERLTDLSLSPSRQAKAVSALADQAIATGATQAAIAIVPRLSLPHEQAWLMADIATQVMLYKREQVAQVDPNTAFMQLDLLATEAVPLAERLPETLFKARAYLAIAQGYAALEDPDQAQQWLDTAIVSTQDLSASAD